MPPAILKHRSAFLAAAAERGFIHQCTDVAALDARLAQVNSTGPLAAYVGYDCTADSLHIGNLMSIMLLRLFQETGNKPIVLMGGGTTRIGDPSGKDEARPLLDDGDIARNMAGIGKVFAKFIRFGDGPGDAVMVNNADWLDELRYIPLLRDIGRHFSVNRMLTQDSVKLRLDRDQPLSFLEFNYLVLQAYDFVELGRRMGCELQMGGSDQWGNIVAGVELGRRSDGRTLFGLTTPLITTASGAKMGKTAQGAVWLNAERLSAYEYWQFWRNTEDADVGRFLRLFTEMPLPEITRLERLADAEINEAKKILATEATALCHGREAAEAAAETASAVFGGLRVLHGDMDVTDDGRLPQVEIRAEQIHGRPAFELFVLAGLAASHSEARRLIRGGGARIDDGLVTNEAQIVPVTRLFIKLSKGKKIHKLVRVIGSGSP